MTIPHIFHIFLVPSLTGCYKSLKNLQMTLFPGIFIPWQLKSFPLIWPSTEKVDGKAQMTPICWSHTHHPTPFQGHHKCYTCCVLCLSKRCHFCVDVHEWPLVEGALHTAWLWMAASLEPHPEDMLFQHTPMI